MFTGIIESIGEVEAVESSAGGARLVIRTPIATGDLKDVPIGASVAVSGACLTVTHNRPGSFTFDVSRETLDRSNIGGLKRSAKVHLERSLQLGGRLDGHIVQGHVDGVGQVIAVESAGLGWRCTYRVPSSLLKLLVLKGSIAIDGVSLTIASLAGDIVGVALVPHSGIATLLSVKRAGESVNIETDIIGKYVARLLGHDVGATPHSGAASAIDEAFLVRHGFGSGGHR